ncbi:MAG: hypothetical protein D3909_00435 [Candidatus Electrothrix sp. ATG1]|nr:hypothetical protein [Candidatus Electrothrix sp. ATG1]
MKMEIYQIYYKKEHVEYLDEAFTPLDVSQNNNPKWCEYQVFLDNEGMFKGNTDEYIAFISWKFFIKTHIRGRELLNAMTDDDSADVFFINPYETSIAGLYKSVWSQLDSVFPGILSTIQYCLDRAGYDLDISTMIMSEDQMAFCNYWIGTKNFWKEYMNFTCPLYDYLEHQLDEETRKYFIQLDKKNGLGLFPHIMERMFSTFLLVRKNQFNVVRIPLPADIQEIDFEIISTCNQVKTGMISLKNKEVAQMALDAQDTMLSHLLRYKQASQKMEKKGPIMRLISAAAKKCDESISYLYLCNR